MIFRKHPHKHLLKGLIFRAHFFTKHTILKYSIIILLLSLPYKEMASRSTQHHPSLSPALIDLYHMAAVIEAEASGEPGKCKCLVGEVLENRAAEQGATISASADNGLEQKPPSWASIETASKILNSKHRHKLLFFHNPKTATDSRWVRKVAGRKKVKCGKQVFYR
jgi:spore germination cell wall hydrolase CwlJ-like protein